MIIINHRINSIEKLRDTPIECGIEIDVRPYGDKLVLQHDPFKKGEDFDKFLKEYNHKLLIVNIKSEGIEEEAIRLVNKYGIKDYFLLDVTFPFMIKYIRKGVRNFAVRFSEFESIQTCLNLKGKVEWVFVDNFTKLPVEDDAFSKLKDNFKICIVSPELLGRDELDITKSIVKKYEVDAVLTDNINGWMS